MKYFVGRPGFSILEVTVALGIMAVVMSLIAQMGYWSLREKMLTEARQTALELSNNVLETARATPWDSLTPAWAAQQKLPDDMDTFLPRGKLAVSVDPEKSGARRVTVVVSWQPGETEVWRKVQLVTLLSERSREGKGEKP
jgi:prepilin-type N-terminal cleavage/methylation domain-containing protein